MSKVPGKQTTVSTETKTTRKFLRNVNVLELSNEESITKKKPESAAKTSKANSHLDVSKILGKQTRN